MFIYQSCLGYGFKTMLKKKNPALFWCELLRRVIRLTVIFITLSLCKAMKNLGKMAKDIRRITFK